MLNTALVSVMLVQSFCSTNEVSLSSITDGSASSMYVHGGQHEQKSSLQSMIYSTVPYIVDLCR